MQETSSICASPARAGETARRTGSPVSCLPAQRMPQKEIRALADRIASYGRKIHHRYPTGDVVVGESDLAAQLRKRPDMVGTALNLLLGEQKVEKAPLSGYWKLNV